MDIGPIHRPARRPAFERCLHEALDVCKSEELATGTRVLDFAVPKRVT